METKSQIGFKLVRIKIDQFALFLENYTKKEPINFTINISFKLNSIARMIGCFVDFTFQEEKNPIIKIQVSCHFNIEKSSWSDLIKDESDSIIFPKEFLAHLAMLTIGTSRGVLFAKLEETVFSDIIIPTIDVTQIVKKEAKFKIENG